MTVRVRFAPSPTGYLHLGSARTVLFNWLWARHVGGEMLLRIEDTDRERSQPELIEVIFDALSWLGIDWDGEPTYQSRSAQRHREVIEQLLAAGRAYRCDCTQDQVQERNAAAGLQGGYDRHCRDRAVSAEVTHVVRFGVPDGGVTEWDDLIRGHIAFEHRNLEDFVLRRRDGTPMFVVANAVDDADSGITHVIRGEDLINATPKMLLVRSAMGVDAPIEFAHLPLIVGTDRKKLSKRQGDVAVADYRERGFLPEAMVNYLALLGWGPDDEVEVRPTAELIELFDIADVSPSPAMFDLAKLESVNAEKLRAMPLERLVEEAEPFLGHLPGYDPRRLDGLWPELQVRVKTLADLPALVDFFFVEPDADEATWTKAIGANEAAPALLDAAIGAYEDPAIEWSAQALHAATLALAEAAGLKLGKAQAPIRVALTGRSAGPPLFESLVVLGRETTLGRLRSARARCG